MVLEMSNVLGEREEIEMETGREEEWEGTQCSQGGHVYKMEVKEAYLLGWQMC